MRTSDEKELAPSVDPSFPGPEEEGRVPEAAAGEIPDDAIFDPDGPIVQPQGEIPDDAIFDPDEPIVRRDSSVQEGVVTGIGGGGARRERWEGDLAWQILRTSHLLESLAQALREHGMEALRIHPQTDPMDAMLRAFVAGYLVGRLDVRG